MILLSKIQDLSTKIWWWAQLQNPNPNAHTPTILYPAKDKIKLANKNWSKLFKACYLPIAKEHPSPGEDLFLEQQQLLAQHQTNPNKIIATVKNNPTTTDTTNLGLDSTIFLQFSGALSPGENRKKLGR